MTSSSSLDVHYRFDGELRQHRFDLLDANLPAHEVLLHLLQLHFGDAENSLLMPPADATPAQIAEQAATLGIELEPAGD